MEEFPHIIHPHKSQRQDQQCHAYMAEKDTGNGMIELFNILFVKFRCSNFLCRHTEPEVKEQGVRKETPQHDPQAVLSFAQVTDEPTGN